MVLKENKTPTKASNVKTSPSGQRGAMNHSGRGAFPETPSKKSAVDTGTLPLDVLASFQTFADSERKKYEEMREERRRFSDSPRVLKLDDLKAFGESFKSRTENPADPFYDMAKGLVKPKEKVVEGVLAAYHAADGDGSARGGVPTVAGGALRQGGQSDQIKCPSVENDSPSGSRYTKIHSGITDQQVAIDCEDQRVHTMLKLPKSIIVGNTELRLLALEEQVNTLQLQAMATQQSFYYHANAIRGVTTVLQKLKKQLDDKFNERTNLEILNAQAAMQIRNDQDQTDERLAETNRAIYRGCMAVGISTGSWDQVKVTMNMLEGLYGKDFFQAGGVAVHDSVDGFSNDNVTDGAKKYKPVTVEEEKMASTEDNYMMGFHYVESAGGRYDHTEQAMLKGSILVNSEHGKFEARKKKDEQVAVGDDESAGIADDLITIQYLDLPNESITNNIKDEDSNSDNDSSPATSDEGNMVHHHEAEGFEGQHGGITGMAAFLDCAGRL